MRPYFNINGSNSNLGRTQKSLYVKNLPFFIVLVPDFIEIFKKCVQE